MLEYLRRTPTFDQLLAGIIVEEVDASGYVRATLPLGGALVSESGAWHEGALMLVVDDVTSMAAIAVGKVHGVSLNLSLSILRQPSAKEPLVIEARALRVGKTVAFLKVEMRQGGEMVATGEHLKHIGQPWFVRLLEGISCRSEIFASMLHNRGMAALEAAKQKYGLTRTNAGTMEELLGLKVAAEKNDGAEAVGDGAEGGVAAVSADGAKADATFNTFSHVALLNAHVCGHGASSAALIAAAVRQYVRIRDGLSGQWPVDFSSLAVSYPAPVPGNAVVNVGVYQSKRCPGRLVAEIQTVAGKLCARGRIDLC